MQTQEIRDTKWQEFCERFNRTFEGTLVSVEEVVGPKDSTVLIRDLPLRGIDFDKTPACSDVMTIRLGRESEKEFEHRIIEPIHLKIRLNNTGAKVLEIQAENGVFWITFHSGKVGALLDGLV
jgi:hypothetical protein